MKKHRLRIDTREQERRARAERAANWRASREGRSLPYPNVWDELDPTKVQANATPEEIHERYEAFLEICPQRPTIEHIL